MGTGLSGVVRFVANVEHGVLLELGDQGASASLAARFHAEFDADPNYATTAVAGISFSLGEERGCCISRTPSPEAANQAIRLLAAKYGPMQRCNRPPHGVSSQQGTTSGIDWTFDLERRRYDSSVVTTWPPLESSRPVRDLIVLEIKDSLTFIHWSSRAGGSCPPTASIDESLTFACRDSAQAWIDRHGAGEPQPLCLRWRSVALSRMDQSDAEVNAGMRG